MNIIFINTFKLGRMRWNSISCIFQPISTIFIPHSQTYKQIKIFHKLSCFPLSPTSCTSCSFRTSSYWRQ